VSPSLIDDYFNSKKKTYWKTWELRDTQYPDGTIHWILFIIGDDDYHTPYYYGVKDSVTEAEAEIKWAIGTYLKSAGLL